MNRSSYLIIEDDKVMNVETILNNRMVKWLCLPAQIAISFVLAFLSPGLSAAGRYDETPAQGPAQNDRWHRSLCLGVFVVGEALTIKASRHKVSKVFLHLTNGKS